MKKFIVLALFGLLIVASTVSAQKLEFKASGMIDFNSVWEHECSFLFRFGSYRPREARWSFQHMGYPCVLYRWIWRPNRGLDHPAMLYLFDAWILKFDAVMSKELSGTIMFEIDGFRYGVVVLARWWPWRYVDPGSERNTFGVLV